MQQSSTRFPNFIGLALYKNYESRSCSTNSKKVNKEGVKSAKGCKMPRCKICGGEYPPEEMVGDICINCMSAMLQKDGIDLGLGIEDL